ncbi:odorant receptor 2a-like [Diabrotica virgifera virgifera]|uniref:Odorant receptor 2a-like n=1 Tax=Diabrotica virgifera virgifera TaxID=50390 RepID=A0A6P7H4C6_DIAVI|nr:odorant receptor 2a-like [Diabrotica virgifera virgifera]XP_050498808.1 odorant receptor 2a-like [Diabrotica virgifera virgifera]
MLAQVFFYSYFGNILQDESDALTNTIYNMNWYDFDEKSKRALLIIMSGMSRPIQMTAGKILVLNLETFKKIMKSTYSLLSIVKKFE